MNVRDMYGNLIQKGDYINYPVRKGAATYMRTAKVLMVAERQPLEGETKAVPVLRVAMAKAPRSYERKTGDWKTKIIKVTVSLPYRTTVVPKSYIQNDRRYSCLLAI